MGIFMTGEQKIDVLTNDPAMAGLYKFTSGNTIKYYKKHGVGLQIFQKTIIEDDCVIIYCRLLLPS